MNEMTVNRHINVTLDRWDEGAYLYSVPCIGGGRRAQANQCITFAVLVVYS